MNEFIRVNGGRRTADGEKPNRETSVVPAAHDRSIRGSEFAGILILCATVRRPPSSIHLSCCR